MKNGMKIIGWLLAGWFVTSCSITYSFSGSAVDYEKVKSISIQDFPNIAPLVYAPLAQQFTESLKDKYTRQTKLRVLSEGGDMNVEGEITGYNFSPLAVSGNSYASQTRLAISIRVRFTNNADPDKDFERTFTAQSEFDNSRLIDEVQDELCDGIMKEIIDQIFNETVATW